MSEKLGQSVLPAVDEPAVREQLRAIIESAAFKGSRRSQQFLQHIVEKALSGRLDELKERNLGVELFGRSPAYDTGEDAIVRVTASDVRKRLAQFYSAGFCALHIEIPSGAYAPEFRRAEPPPAAAPVVAEIPATPAAVRLPIRWGRWVAIGGLVLAAAAIGGYALRSSRQQVLPWSVLFQAGHHVPLVFADPDISVLQELSGIPVTLSDYANRRYEASLDTLAPDLQRALRRLRGANVPAVDVGIALNLASLAANSGAQLRTHRARSLQLVDFKTDDDFILLGSPRSNPWVSLFQDQLDFGFSYDPEKREEVILNRRPRPGEPARYVPTAKGGDTGQAFATVTFTGNLNQNGRILLLAGTNAEGTEAAGKLVTNADALRRLLEKNGIDPAGPPRYFQALLEVRTMAGSPNSFEVVAFHRLANSPAP